MSERGDSYLTELDRALAGAPPGLRADIVAGVREELDGLGEAEASSRIADLGEPEFIAAAALSASAPVEPSPHRATGLVAALVMIVGPFVLPVIGGVVGLAWVSFSRAWTRREKGAAWVITGAAVVVTVIFVALFTPGGSVGRLLVPFSSTRPVVLLPGLVVAIAGVVLLVRASRRGWRQ